MLRAQYAHVALCQLGPVHTFNLNLRPDIEAKALASPDGPVDFLRRRIGHELQRALGRPIALYFVLEETYSICKATDPWRMRRRLHLHGEFAVTDNEAEAARRALRRAGGEWPKNRDKQAFTDPSPDEFWPGYCTKHLLRTRPFTRSMPAYCNVRFDGSAVFVTRELSRLAGDLYSKDRHAVLKHKAS